MFLPLTDSSLGHIWLRWMRTYTIISSDDEGVMFGSHQKCRTIEHHNSNWTSHSPKLTKTNSNIADFHIRKPSNEGEFSVIIIFLCFPTFFDICLSCRPRPSADFSPMVVDSMKFLLLEGSEFEQIEQLFPYFWLIIGSVGEPLFRLCFHFLGWCLNDGKKRKTRRKTYHKFSFGLQML